MYILLTSTQLNDRELLGSGRIQNHSFPPSNTDTYMYYVLINTVFALFDAGLKDVHATLHMNIE